MKPALADYESIKVDVERQEKRGLRHEGTPDCVLAALTRENMEMTDWQTLVGLVEAIPDLVWGAAVSFALSIPTLFFTLRHSRQLQAIQLGHDAHERSRERQMSWRREVYLYAAESISRLSGLIGMIADLEIPDERLSSGFQEDIAKIARIQVIANDKTIAAVNAFTGEVAVVYVQLFVDRALLCADKKQIQALSEELERSKKARQEYQAILVQRSETLQQDQSFRLAISMEIQVSLKKAEYCSTKIQELMDQLPRAQLALMKSTSDAGFRLGPLITPALFAIREELEMRLDEEAYLRQSNEFTNRLQEAYGSSMRRVDQIIAEG
jgi:hypothetical protein